MPPTSFSSTLPVRHICNQCRARLLLRPTTRAITTSLQRSQAARPSKLSNTTADTPDPTIDPAALPPRWMRTPAGMKQPYSPKPPNANNDFPVNEDPVILDRAIARMLGSDASGSVADVLDEEVKWLAVTHKSFDQGRRGFNDRLAFLGKRITELQTSLALLDAPQSTQQLPSDPFNRPIPHDSALEGIENLTPQLLANSIDKVRVAELAERYGLHQVIRWKPRQVRRLKASGIETVLAHTVFALVGAVALRKGGKAAAGVVRERVLRPLGVLSG